MRDSVRSIINLLLVGYFLEKTGFWGNKKHTDSLHGLCSSLPLGIMLLL